MNGGWEHSLNLVFKRYRRPSVHFDYGGWYRNGRHNVLLNAWVGWGVGVQVSFSRVKP